MSSLDRAVELRAQADALETLASLEADVLAAKRAYNDDPSPENRAAKQAAMEALREARALTRTEGVSVGGDAYIAEEA